MRKVRKFISICSFVAVAGVFAGHAQSEESTTTSTSGDTTQISKDTTNESTLQGKLEHLYPSLGFLKNVNLSGYLDLTYEYNLNNPKSGSNQLRVFDTESNSAAVRMFQFMLEKQTKDLGDVGFRVKLDIGEDAKVITPYGFSTNNFDLEEAYVTYRAPLGKGLDLTFGKWAALMGAEVIESKDDYNISRSFLFGYAEPFTHTGLKAGYTFNDHVSGVLAVVNGWDNVSDNNSGKTGMAQLTLTPITPLTLAFCGMYGPEQNHDNHDNRASFDFVGTYKAMDKLTLVTNYDYGYEDHAAPTGMDAQWQGVAGYVNYAFTPKINATARGEWFSDRDGARTGTAQDLVEGTLTGEYKLNDNFKFRLEYRHDHSNAATFENSSGGFGKEQDTIAFETLFIF